MKNLLVRQILNLTLGLTISLTAAANSSLDEEVAKVNKNLPVMVDPITQWVSQEVSSIDKTTVINRYVVITTTSQSLKPILSRLQELLTQDLKKSTCGSVELKGWFTKNKITTMIYSYSGSDDKFILRVKIRLSDCDTQV